MRAHDIPMPDFGDFTNSIVNGPSTPAIVSFDIEWSGVADRVTVDASNNAGFGGSDWGGEFATVGVTAEWSSRQDGFTFQSDPASTSQQVFGWVGKERNGVFFP